jgi:hypothetical protein
MSNMPMQIFGRVISNLLSSEDPYTQLAPFTLPTASVMVYQPIEHPVAAYSAACLGAAISKQHGLLDWEMNFELIKTCSRAQISGPATGGF